MFCPIIGQTVVPGGEVPGEKQPLGPDDESHAQARLSGLHTVTAGRAAAQ